LTRRSRWNTLQWLPRVTTKAPGITGIHRALADPTRVRLLELLWFGRRTVKELGDALDMPPDRLYYHLDLLEKGGLVKVVELRPAARGRVERVYAPADHEPPTDETSVEDREAFLAAMIEATLADLHAAMARKKAGGRDKVNLLRSTIFLDPDRQEEMRARLDALAEEFRSEPGTPGSL